MGKDYLDKWEERAKKNTDIIEQQQTKTKKMSKEILITKENVKDLKVGDTVKFHNGYEWDTKVLGEFELSRGYVTTGVHSETASFINPMFKSMYKIKQR
jgi:hypothetical protein